MKWAEISIRTNEERSEKVIDCLYEIGVNGVVIEDPALVGKYIKENCWDCYDQKLLEYDFEGVVIKGYLPAKDELLLKVEELKEI